MAVSHQRIPGLSKKLALRDAEIESLKRDIAALDISFKQTLAALQAEVVVALDRQRAAERTESEIRGALRVAVLEETYLTTGNMGCRCRLCLAEGERGKPFQHHEGCIVPGRAGAEPDVIPAPAKGTYGRRSARDAIDARITDMWNADFSTALIAMNIGLSLNKVQARIRALGLRGKKPE